MNFPVLSQNKPQVLSEGFIAPPIWCISDYFPNSFNNLKGIWGWRVQKSLVGCTKCATYRGWISATNPNVQFFDIPFIEIFTNFKKFDIRLLSCTFLTVVPAETIYPKSDFITSIGDSYLKLLVSNGNEGGSFPRQTIRQKIPSVARKLHFAKAREKVRTADSGLASEGGYCVGAWMMRSRIWHCDPKQSWIAIED